MTRLKHLLCAFAALCMANAALAEVEQLDLYLYGSITQRSKNQIVRLLSYYMPKENISFRQMKRDDGSIHPWVSVVEIKPQGWPLNIYNIVQRIDDDRGVNDGRRLWKAEVTASGELRNHLGFARGRIGRPAFAPFFERGSPGIWTYMDAPYPRERLVFHPSLKFDNLRLLNRANRVRIKGRIAGFDRIYPIVVLTEFEETDEQPGRLMQWRRQMLEEERKREPRRIIRRNAF